MDSVAKGRNQVVPMQQTTQVREHSKVGAIWISLAAFMVILLLLAIFILQNSTSVEISYFGFHGSLTFGVAMLFAVVLGAVLALLIGSVRILQLKSQKRKLESSSSGQ